MMAVLAAIKKRLNVRLGGERERTFLERSMQYLSTASGCQVQVEDWMITSYEVEFGQQIGAGGLYVAPLLWYPLFTDHIGSVGKSSKGIGIILQLPSRLLGQQPELYQALPYANIILKQRSVY